MAACYRKQLVFAGKCCAGKLQVQATAEFCRKPRVLGSYVSMLRVLETANLVPETAFTNPPNCNPQISVVLNTQKMKVY